MELQNGNRTKERRSRFMLQIFLETVGRSSEYVCYVLNRTGQHQLKIKAPITVVFKEVINIDHLHVFGTECFVHVPQQKGGNGTKE
ncbi:hypothetical protein TNCT_692131 [Trichonephila clavata]|uniref:Uncharacterized protein n=1 Tax=Trichonephila clavata TaxID=2740835 RepID=A0A8X6LJP4_TRICU|nr:hypothetical protein TNCT_692131 [Trichonephila clavata]